jgi:hypothetical protein
MRALYYNAPLPSMYRECHPAPVHCFPPAPAQPLAPPDAPPSLLVPCVCRQVKQPMGRREGLLMNLSSGQLIEPLMGKQPNTRSIVTPLAGYGADKHRAGLITSCITKREQVQLTPSRSQSAGHACVAAVVCQPSYPKACTPKGQTSGGSTSVSPPAYQAGQTTWPYAYAGHC